MRMTRAVFDELLAQRPWLLADGATGTNLFDRGLMSGDAPELWNEQHPERIEDLHRGFVEAGADLILTNSFGGNRYRLKLHQAEDRAAEINRRAAEIARRIADAADRPVVVAGSMGPTGEIFAARRQPVPRRRRGRLRRAGAGAQGRRRRRAVDRDHSSQEELSAAVEGAAAAKLPIVVTMSFDTNGRTMMGITPPAFGELARALPVQPAAIGANCGTGASELIATVAGIAEARPDAVIVAKGNCGIPEYHDGHIHYSGTPELMAEYARMALDAGARIIGGCCGTTAEHSARHAPGARNPCPRPPRQSPTSRPASAPSRPWRTGGMPRRCHPRPPPPPRLTQPSSTATAERNPARNPEPALGARVGGKSVSAALGSQKDEGFLVVA
jgi:methionine synthase I (cobalamin-dependent)